MRYQFIDCHRDEYAVGVLCRVLDVSRSGYYAWRGRPMSIREQQDQHLRAQIRRVHQKSKGRYGAPRVHAELRAQGQRCGRKRVARLMHEAGLRGRGKRKYRVTTDSEHAQPVAENLVLRQFGVKTPNTVWAADMTYVWTREGWLYLAVVIDLHSRRVVGWSMSERMTTNLPLAALQMAYERRRPPPGLLHHSDRGSQYASRAYRLALEGMGMTCSMSRKGDCWDNAVVESFFANLKREEVADSVYATRQEARSALFSYLEMFYNRERRHSSLGYLSPTEFEQSSRAA